MKVERMMKTNADSEIVHYRDFVHFRADMLGEFKEEELMVSEKINANHISQVATMTSSSGR